MLATAPGDVRLLFDDEVRPAGGDRAVDAAGPLGARRPGPPPARERPGARHPAAPRAPARRVQRPLARRLERRPPDQRRARLRASAPARRGRCRRSRPAAGRPRTAVVLRLLFLAGVLLAGGAALTARLLGAGRRLRALVVATALVLVAAGGFGLLALEPAADATRFGRVTETAAIVGARRGGRCARVARAPGARRSSRPRPLSLVLGAPTLAGHALDPHRLRGLVALADFVHVLAAAVWIGGLRPARARALAPGAAPLPGGRARLASPLLGAAAIPRAIAAFPVALLGRATPATAGPCSSRPACSSSCSPSPGRTGDACARLGFVGELVAARRVVGDGRRAHRPASARRAQRRCGRGAGAAATRRRRRRTSCSRRQDDDVAVGLAASPRGRERRGAGDGARARREGRGRPRRPDRRGVAPERCGPGCYAATIPLPRRRGDRRLARGPGVGRRTLVFTLPARWPAPAAGALVDRVDRVFRGLRTRRHPRAPCVLERTNAITTTYRVAGAEPPRLPDRRRARGGRDRRDALGSPPGADAGSAPSRSRSGSPSRSGDPTRCGTPACSDRADDRPVVSFYDPKLPAWFELSIDPRTGRLLALRMTAEAHFMRHRYSGFDAPLEIVPPRATQP